MPSETVVSEGIFVGSVVKHPEMDGSLGAPEHFYDLLIVPALAVFFGLFAQFIGWNRRRMGRKSTAWTWVAVVVLGLGIYVGARTVWNLYDPELGSFYRNTIWSKKTLFSHYLALVLPSLSLAAVIVWNLMERRLGRPIAI